MNNLRQAMTKRRIAGLVFMFLAIVFAILIEMSKGVWRQFFEVFGVLFCILTIERIFLDEAGKEKLKNIKLLRDIIEKILGTALKIARAVSDFFTVSRGSYKGKIFIRGYKDTSQSIANLKKSKKRNKKHKRYKDMNNIERVRFLYEKKVTGAIKKGVAVNETMTPNEVGSRMLEEKYMQTEGTELIDAYNIARYDEKSDFTDSQVLKLKKI